MASLPTRIPAHFPNGNRELGSLVDSRRLVAADGLASASCFDSLVLVSSPCGLFQYLRVKELSEQLYISPLITAMAPCSHSLPLGFPFILDSFFLHYAQTVEIIGFLLVQRLYSKSSPLFTLQQKNSIRGTLPRCMGRHSCRSISRLSTFQTSTGCRSAGLYINKKWVK